MKIIATYNIVDEAQAREAAAVLMARVPGLQGWETDDIEQIGIFLVSNLDVAAENPASFELADIGLEMESITHA